DGLCLDDSDLTVMNMNGADVARGVIMSNSKRLGNQYVVRPNKLKSHASVKVPASDSFMRYSFMDAGALNRTMDLMRLTPKTVPCEGFSFLDLDLHENLTFSIPPFHDGCLGDGAINLPKYILREISGSVQRQKCDHGRFNGSVKMSVEVKGDDQVWFMETDNVDSPKSLMDMFVVYKDWRLIDASTLYTAMSHDVCTELFLKKHDYSDCFKRVDGYIVRESLTFYECIVHSVIMIGKNNRFFVDVTPQPHKSHTKVCDYEVFVPCESAFPLVDLFISKSVETCSRCGRPGSIGCNAGCGYAFYCSKRCSQLHRSLHRLVCKKRVSELRMCDCELGIVALDEDMFLKEK
ncbi:MAG: hypothetical protein K0U52_06790, partial [Gammaproteobacteria bacterium]|nr:hypothetical protein [Gammaproteobacteria bacterium]